MTTIAERLAVELGAPQREIDGRRLVPMLCGRDETGERILGHEGFLYELKLDGVRIVADKRGSQVSLAYRRGRDATASYGEIEEAMRALGEDRVVLDGEVVAFDAAGRPDFQRLGTRIQTRGHRSRAEATVPVVYVVFDILAIGDRDLTKLPLEHRKAILEQVVPDEPAKSPRIRRHPTFADGRELFRRCREHELEGVVAKRFGSPYVIGDRSNDWVKIKCELDIDLVVIGWTEGEGRRSRLGALDLGEYEDGHLVVRGRVGSGLDEDMIDHLLERLAPLLVPRAVARGKYEPKRNRRHVKPEIVVSVRHLGLSHEGVLRHPVFRGLRADVRPEDCVAARGVKNEEGALAHRVKLTSPRTVAMADGRTKKDLCVHYESHAAEILALTAGRLVLPLRRDDRAPRGLAALGPLPDFTPSWVHAAVVPRKRRDVRGLVLSSFEQILFALEIGAVAFELSNARERALRAADFAALSITGSGAGTLAGAEEAAARAVTLARELGLEAFVGEGHHDELEVLVPLGSAPWEATQIFTELFAKLVQRAVADAASPAPRVTVEPRDRVLLPHSAIAAPAGAVRLEARARGTWSRGIFEAEVDLTAAVRSLERLLLQR